MDSPLASSWHHHPQVGYSPTRSVLDGIKNALCTNNLRNLLALVVDLFLSFSSMEVDYLGCRPTDLGRCWSDHRVVAQSGLTYQSCMPK